MRTIVHEQLAVDGVSKLEERDIGAGINLQYLRMNDAVGAQDKRSRGGLRGKELRIARGEQWHRLLAEPAQHLIRGEAQHLRGRPDESPKLLIRIASQRGVSAIRSGSGKKLIPCVISVLMGDDCFQKIEDDAFHTLFPNLII